MRPLSMRPLKIFTVTAVIGASAFGAAFAQHHGGADVLAGYEKTGDVVTCLPLTQVRDSDPVDDNAILFELRNGDMYLNELRGQCIGLMRNDRYSYKTTQNQICSGDILTVANPVGTPVGSCGLGAFEALSKISTD